MKDVLSARIVAHYLGDSRGLPKKVRAELAGYGVQVLAAADRASLRKLVAAVPADLLLACADVLVDVARAVPALRRLYGRPGLALIVLAPRALESAELARLLAAGASDVIPAPFESALIAARIDAALRTVEQLCAPVRWPRGVLRSADGDIAVDLRGHRCLVREGAGYREVLLTRKQLAALAALLRAGGRPVTWEELFRRGWRPGKLRRRSRTLVQHVIVLRRKLGAAGRRIAAVPGVGYRILS